MAEDGVADVSRLIDERPIGRFQIQVAVLCALAVFMDGFDTQTAGYVLPAIASAPSSARPWAARCCPRACRSRPCS